MEHLPVACSLSDAEFANRAAQLRTGVMARAVDGRMADDGMTFRFPYSADLAREIVAMIGLERECCQFLEFRLEFEHGLGGMRLAMSGPEGTREFVATAFLGQDIPLR